MCGVGGKVYFDEVKVVEPLVIKKMMASMDHRGPDDEGLYISGRVGLGHKRLSIIDLNTGKQPISNEDGSVWVVFNGEIYNYKELRKILLTKGHHFKTETDTEVLVHLYEEFGESFINKLRGMFAFALWDEKVQQLLLVRDRVGIKPLYYSVTEESFTFASEMKALLTETFIKPEINTSGVDRFFTYYYLPGHDTLIRGIEKLEPGHYLTLRGNRIEKIQYWDLDFSSDLSRQSLKESKIQLVDLLRETVRGHMTSDVPVGFLLSGGLDSTALLSLARETHEDISTFTVGFDDPIVVDERPYARIAARKFGTKHYEMTITAKDFWDFLPKYVWHMEEPVCEVPAIALYYISKLAKDHVKVLISGEGGDEAFAGYQNYRNIVWFERLKRILGPLTGPASIFAQVLARFISFKRLRGYIPLMNIPLEDYYYSRTSGPNTFTNSQINLFYSEEFRSKIDRNASSRVTKNYFNNVSNLGTLNKMLYLDTKTWLPDDLLVKADKMTMANSVELRVPFLDHQILEFTAGLPAHYKISGFTTKYILKEAFMNSVPEEIIHRKKAGFPVPYEGWLRNELKSLVHDLLTDLRTLQRGYFNKKTVEKLISENSSERNYSKEIYSLIIFELWHRMFLEHFLPA